MDTYDLGRYVHAQAPVYHTVLEELRAGLKQTHWMWYIFPQLQGLGQSQMARFYAITSLEEAHAYLLHPVLGARLVECAQAVLSVPGKSAQEILGSPDDFKLRSCMTLFASVENAPPVFNQVLEKYYQGLPDSYTVKILRQNP